MGLDGEMAKKTAKKISKTAAKVEDVTRVDDSTRVKLQKAALKLFAEQGYDGTSTKQICDAAGANTAAIAYHFGTKEKLFLSMLTDRFENDAVRIGSLLKKASSLSEFRVRLEMVCESLLEARRLNSDFHQVLLTEARHFPSVMELLHKGIAKTQLPLVEFVKDAKAKGLVSKNTDPDFVALIVFSHCMGPSVEIARQISPALDVRDDKKREQYIKKLLAILEFGILSKENQS